MLSLDGNTSDHHKKWEEIKLSLDELQLTDALKMSDEEECSFYAYVVSSGEKLATNLGSSMEILYNILKLIFQGSNVFSSPVKLYKASHIQKGRKVLQGARF